MQAGPSVETYELSVTEQERLAAIGLSVPKTGFKQPPGESEDTQPLHLARYAGNVLHAVDRVANSDMTDEQKGDWKEERYGGGIPDIIYGWADAAFDTVPKIKDQQPQPSGYESVWNGKEVPLYLGKIAVEAQTAIEGKIIEERVEAEKQKRSTPGQFEHALRYASDYLQSRDVDVLYDIIDGAEVQDPSFYNGDPGLPPLTAEDAELLVRNIQEVRFGVGRNGDLYMSPTTRIDNLNLYAKSGSKKAQYIAESFAQLLKEGVGFDREKLATTKVLYGEGDNQKYISGLEAAYRAAIGLQKGWLKMEVLDIKTLSHLGAVYEDLEPLWTKKNGERNELSYIFSDKNLAKDGKEYDALRRLWFSIATDVAKTTYAVANFFRQVDLDYHEQNPEKPWLDLNTLMYRVKAGAILVDFDIRKNGDGGGATEGSAPAQELPYPTVPMLSETGVPVTTSAFRKDVPFELQRRYWDRWERVVYADYSRFIGRLAVQKAAEAEAEAAVA